MLDVRGLSKRYGERKALDGLSLAIPAAQFVALLGPNGAGKSTLFQVLTGLFVADEGEVSVAGHSLRDDAVKALKHIGVVFQQMSLDLDLSVRRNLQFHADLHGLPRAVARERITGGLPGPGHRRPTSTARCVNSPAATAARWNWCGPCCTGPRCC